MRHGNALSYQYNVKELSIPTEKWKSYEEVARYLLYQFAKHFGLGKFEGKQIIVGESGTNWGIDCNEITPKITTFTEIKIHKYF